MPGIRGVGPKAPKANVSVSVKLDGIAQAASRIHNTKNRTVTAIKKQVGRSAFSIQREAKKGTPSDTGNLRGSITVRFEILPGGYFAQIGPGSTAAAYAQTVEFGSKPHPKARSIFAARKHMPPPEALTNWIKRKGLPKGLEYPIARKIYMKGTEPQPYLVPAYKQEVLNFRSAVDSILRNPRGAR